MTCKKCLIEKSVGEFYPYRLGECKECTKKRTAADWRKRQALDPKADRTARRAYHMMTKYGLSLEEIEFLLEAQDDKCAICKAPESGGAGTWHVDHDHKTGQIRGLLCWRCNTKLAALEGEWRQLAENYLARPPAPIVLSQSV